MKVNPQLTAAHAPSARQSESVMSDSITPHPTPVTEATPTLEAASSGHRYRGSKKSPNYPSNDPTVEPESVGRLSSETEPWHSLSDINLRETIRKKGTEFKNQPEPQERAARETSENPVIVSWPQHHHGSDSCDVVAPNESDNERDLHATAKERCQSLSQALGTEHSPNNKANHSPIQKEDDNVNVITDAYKKLPLLPHVDETSAIPNPHSTTYTPTMSARISHQIDKMLAADAKARAHDERLAEKHAARDAHQRAKEEAKAASEAQRARDKEEESHRHADQRADRASRKKEKETARIRKEDAKRRRRAQGGISWGFEPSLSKYHHRKEHDDENNEEGVEVGSQNLPHGCTGHGRHGEGVSQD